ncbi:MAG: hypothetical protein KZQ83_06660 [gamma proteobacterium symbiont of Taylorina sp.]|nr:hypothetical protein [gamma proteobacterium symbiont of Taylorina sp.]
MKKVSKQDIEDARVFTEDYGISIPDDINEADFDRLIDKANIKMQKRGGAFITSFISSEEGTEEIYQDIIDGKIAASEELMKTAINNASYLPKKISISIGGYGGSNYSLKFNDDGVVPFDYNGEERPIPTEKRWNKFWQKLDKLKVWGWERKYYDPDVLDATQWEVIIIYDGNKKIISDGSNYYPKGFKKFLKAVRKLIGGLDFS